MHKRGSRAAGAGPKARTRPARSRSGTRTWQTHLGGQRWRPMRQTRRSTHGAEAQRWRQRRDSTQVRATSHARRNDMTWCSISSGSALRRSTGAAAEAAAASPPDVSPAEHSLGFFAAVSSSIWPALRVDSFLASEFARKSLDEIEQERRNGSNLRSDSSE
jgi:hypothetical protein